MQEEIEHKTVNLAISVSYTHLDVYKRQGHIQQLCAGVQLPSDTHRQAHQMCIRDRSRSRSKDNFL